MIHFDHLGDPSGISWETLGALWSIQNRPNWQKLEIVLTGVTKRVPRRLAGSILGVILDDFLDVIRQFGIINGLREREQGRTRKDQGSERGRARKKQNREEREKHKEVTGKIRGGKGEEQGKGEQGRTSKEQGSKKGRTREKQNREER